MALKLGRPRPSPGPALLPWSPLGLRLGAIGQGGGGVPPAWEPITGLGSKLVDWLSADRADLITQSSGLVSSWAGALGVVTVTQATDASKPIYSATGWNSGAGPAITADGVDDFLQMTPIPNSLLGNGSFEFWALVDQQRAPSDSAIAILFAIGNGQNVSRSLNRSQGSGVNIASAVQGNGSTAVASNAPGDFSGRHVIRGVFSATSVVGAMDGSAGSSGSSAANIATARIRLFANAGGANNYFKGSLRDLLLIAGSLTAGETTSLYAYMSAKK